MPALELPFGPKGWTPQRLGDLSGKTYVITGTTTGLGLQATKLFISKGAKVVMLNRDPNKSAAVMQSVREEFPGESANLSFVKMDLAELSSVREAAAQLLEGDAAVSTIDALICNAAIAQVPKQKLTKDGFESQLGVNHMAHFLLCGLLFAKVEASQGRIVVVSSDGYRMGLKKISFDDLNFDKKYNPMNVYSQSKLAQTMFAYELQRRVQASGKKVSKGVGVPSWVQSHGALPGGDQRPVPHFLSVQSAHEDVVVSDRRTWVVARGDVRGGS
eukprot:TRINITY_DN96348_c0_g1_i1.p1 TRINITY_DN96348_c0_g1~~TRINITY_DN96348_c0_g1_i1.p1  ORF type:complete len:273 (+),score=45.56 TRINITY_DN96348_c0_g1_i1:51-869(+)